MTTPKLSLRNVTIDGIERPARLPETLPSGALLDELCRDTAAWWTACTDGRDMLFVAGNLCTQGDELHRAVVRAACACAREALPVWEANYPNDRRPQSPSENE
jgi:hypothetical protein